AIVRIDRYVHALRRVLLDAAPDAVLRLVAAGRQPEDQHECRKYEQCTLVTSVHAPPPVSAVAACLRPAEFHDITGGHAFRTLVPGAQAKYAERCDGHPRPVRGPRRSPRRRR